MKISSKISNFVFGMECLGCKSTSEYLDPWLCPNCKKKLINEGKEPKYPNEDTLCLFSMQTLTRRLIHALKYKNIPGIASYLVKSSSLKKGGDAFSFFSVFAKPYYFVPVPLHSARFRERGYNQAEKIASAFSYVMQGSLSKWLYRKSFHESQTKLSREEREWNVAGAFSFSRNVKIPSKGTVFIVDDVYTTGATTSACLNSFGKDFPLPIKVCSLLYEEQATAAMDYVADVQAYWDV